MTIELNLVFSQGIYASVFSLLARQRTKIESTEDTMAAVLKFLNDNSEVLRDTLSDEDLINRIISTEFLTISEFMSLKYLLASSGVDVLVYEVADLEVDPESIPEDQTEYMIINDLDITNGVKLASKFVVPSKEIDLYSVYAKAIEVGNFFTTELTKGYKNPLLNALSTLKQSEQLLGNSPVGITTAIESMLKYLGISIVAITNQ